MRVTILRSGNRIAVDPTTDAIRTLLVPQLTFTEKTWLRGLDLVRARRDKRPVVLFKDWEAYTTEHRGRLVTSYGFMDKLIGLLMGAGYEVFTQDLTPADESKFRTNWPRVLEKWTPRYGQMEALKIIEQFDNGRFDCPPGWGKGTLIGKGAQLFPYAKIGAVCKSVEVVRTRLFPELCQLLPDVGIVGGGQKRLGHRVMVYTMDSLHHAPDDLDILFIDECHLAATDKAARSLARFDKARMFGFSGSIEMRSDGKSFREEAIFGPVRLHLTDQECVGEGVIVPVEVHWTDVRSDYNPCTGCRAWEKDRRGIWTHDYRNDRVAEDARRHPDEQVLVTVSTIEHGLHLKRRLPEFELVYAQNGIKDEDFERFSSQGLIYDGYVPMTLERRANLTKAFERGELTKAICNSVWNVGVDFRRLAVLCRANGDSSRINDTQIPGRTRRIHEETNKTVSIIHDYLDQFDKGYQRKAGMRRKSYVANGWTQVMPTRSRNLFAGAVVEGDE